MEIKQAKLYDAARKLFLEQGFKATNIASIASKAGVAVGTFYNFYPSKSAIFIDIYNAENEQVKQSILSEVDLSGDPKKVVRKIVQEILKQSQANLILQEWFVNAALNRQISKTNKNAVTDSVVYATLMTLIDSWEKRKVLKAGMSKERIISLFNALTVIDFHQSEIQTDNYFQVLNDLIDGILLVILK